MWTYHWYRDVLKEIHPCFKNVISRLPPLEQWVDKIFWDEAYPLYHQAPKIRLYNFVSVALEYVKIPAVLHSFHQNLLTELVKKCHYRSLLFQIKVRTEKKLHTFKKSMFQNKEGHVSNSFQNICNSNMYLHLLLSNLPFHLYVHIEMEW